jgi:hypothetical protein
LNFLQYFKKYFHVIAIPGPVGQSAFFNRNKHCNQIICGEKLLAMPPRIPLSFLEQLPHRRDARPWREEASFKGDGSLPGQFVSTRDILTVANVLTFFPLGLKVLEAKSSHVKALGRPSLL